MFLKFFVGLVLTLGLAACAARSFDDELDPENPFQDVTELTSYMSRARQPGGMDFVKEELLVADLVEPYLYRVRASNGDQLFRRTLRNSAFGVADDETFVWVTEPGSAQLIRVAPDGEQVQVLPVPGGTPRGVAFKDLLLWVIGTERMIIKIDPTSGPVDTPIPVPTIEQPGGLTFRGEELWVIDQSGSRLVQIALDDGHELVSLTLPGNAVGLASDDENFYYSDTTGRIHIIALKDED